MIFRQTQENLDRLLDYLHRRHQLPMEFINKIELVHDPEHDKENADDPRAFCYVTEKDFRIFCTKYIEKLPVASRLGILLHEIGHLYTDAFGPDEVEVDVDEWCMEFAPELKYTYQDVVYIRNKNEVAEAKNLQWLEGYHGMYR